LLVQELHHYNRDQLVLLQVVKQHQVVSEDRLLLLLMLMDQDLLLLPMFLMKVAEVFINH
jgi:hypothetical protein